MSQSIVIQVGQCGNQIGCRFWDLVLREHAAFNKKGTYDEALSSFFRNVDARGDEHCAEDVIGGRNSKICYLKARAVLVDMEEGVVNHLVQSPLGEIFDQKCTITDMSGSGNNWAVGHEVYGPRHREEILQKVRASVELCNSLQCFFLIHSMGGGTGAGLGTYILGLLEENFPLIYRFVIAVYPSADDDVVTSPYNSVLAMRELTEHAHCVIPVENQALVDIVNEVGRAAGTGSRQSVVTESQGCLLTNPKAFDTMNNIVANLLLNLTSSARFEGSLNVDLSEITMNMVPFPRLHYLVSSMAPLYALADVNMPPRRLDQMFLDAFSKENQLIQADPKHGLYLACALMVRGNVQVSDIRRNIERLKSSLHFITWNQEGWKTGLCSVAPVGQPHMLLTLANNTCVTHTFSGIREHFNRLYKRKAHLHHYTEVTGMDLGCFSEALSSLTSVIDEYGHLEGTGSHLARSVPRMRIAV
uniref:tubulin epsilon chain isoform X2 n=1 Tax=Myxine glutinosa TaxID=7769 RepID=UPI00358E9399